MDEKEAAKAKLLIATLQKYGYDLEDPSRTSSTTSTNSSSDSTEWSPDDDVEPAAARRFSVTSSAGILALRDRKNQQSALHIAAKKGHFDVLRALAKLPRLSEHLNAGDRHCNTALHFAASSTRSNARISPSSPSSPTGLRAPVPCSTLNELVNGTTYLHMAVDRQLGEIGGALVQGGASINVPDHNGVMSLLDPLKDCALCGRAVCKNCSQKASEIRKSTSDGSYATLKDKDEGRFCAVCCTVKILKSKKHNQRENFNKKLMGCGMK
ncbi:Ankyrin repeat-containing domain [Phytophthora cactorum]|nr:Ankyrin repeat-containing domain [Phytophthora cactorum]